MHAVPIKCVVEIEIEADFSGLTKHDFPVIFLVKCYEKKGPDTQHDER